MALRHLYMRISSSSLLSTVMRRIVVADEHRMPAITGILPSLDH